MIRIDYQDFFYRKNTMGRLGRKAIPESKESFLSRMNEFFNQDNKKVINIESTEFYVRVWYREEVE